MAINLDGQPTGFMWYFERIWIDAEHEKCRQHMKECPEVPVANKRTLEMYADLLREKVNAEARLKLLRKAILSDLRPEFYGPTS